MCWQYGLGGAEKFVLPPATQISEEGAGEASTRTERRKAKSKNRPLEKLDRQSALRQSALTRINSRKLKNAPLNKLDRQHDSLEEFASVLSLKRLLDADAPDKQHPLPDTFRPMEKVRHYDRHNKLQLNRDELRATRECLSRCGSKLKPIPFARRSSDNPNSAAKAVAEPKSCTAAEAKAAIQEEDELFFSMRQSLYSVGLQSPTEFTWQKVQCPYCKALVKASRLPTNARLTPLEQHQRNSRKCLEQQKRSKSSNPSLVVTRLTARCLELHNLTHCGGVTNN